MDDTCKMDTPRYLPNDKRLDPVVQVTPIRLGDDLERFVDIDIQFEAHVLAWKGHEAVVRLLARIERLSEGGFLL